MCKASWKHKSKIKLWGVQPALNLVFRGGASTGAGVGAGKKIKKKCEIAIDIPRLLDYNNIIGSLPDLKCSFQRGVLADVVRWEMARFEVLGAQ